ncbi:hypothetical protein BW21_1860 [Burkholderia humptydooensis]|uniref:hypothetical protein n=1 Tax=Burkholderia TaxID=32008 RepID=UPI0005BA0C8B|nr:MULTISPECIES: hypothetical protein [Burkholderia]AJY43228.1 hypothetical protein BW21_1860 [Burkholderia sp. 2002721687]ALX42484.1 hypothetical protein AQ610_08675 [Burkholderia humptydooensis]
MIGPHTQLIRARIAFSHTGLHGDHSWLVKPESERAVSDAPIALARRGIAAMPTGELALHWAASLEDQMLRLAKELMSNLVYGGWSAGNEKAVAVS